MTDTQNDHDSGEVPEEDTELAACRQRVEELQGELAKALWELGYFVTMTCALSHHGRTECDCEERIRVINERLHTPEMVSAMQPPNS